MSTAAQAVRPKQAPASPDLRRREKPKHALLSASPRYLRASIRLGGLHDPQEHEAERAASTIVAGGCHRVLDPGGSTHLRAAGADAPAASAPTPAVVDPGAAGRVRRAATHAAVDPGGSRSLRASPASPVSDIRPLAETSAEPVRQLNDPGGAGHLRAAAAPPVIDPGASGRVRRSPATQQSGSEHGHPMMSAGAGDADAEAAHRIEIARAAPARPLAATVRSRLEHGFGEPMASVRVDTSPAARAAAGAIGARAYTEGERITLGRGESEHDLGLMAHEATHVVQNRRAGNLARAAATPSTEIRREIQAASDSEDSRTYRMADGRTIELPDDMTAEEAHQLEAEGLAAKRRLGHGPPPMPVPDVRKPADKSKKAAVKAPHHGVGGSAGRHAHGPRSVGVVARLHPVGGVVGRYLIAKAMPMLARGVGKLGILSRHEQTHDNAGQKVHQAESAVVIPPSEGQSKSNFGQVGVVAGRPAPVIDESKGKRELTESLAQNVPRTIEDVDNFKRDMKAQHTGADVLKVVQVDKNAVVVTFADMEHTPPPLPPEHPSVPLPPQEAAPPTAAMNLGQGAIAQLLPQHTDVGQYTKGADDRLREEGVTQEQLDMVDSGELAEANKDKKGLEKAARSEPLAVQKFAQDAATQVDHDLRHEEKAERGALVARRRHGLNETGHQQKGAQTALEKKRDEVAAQINAKYQTAQDSVKKKLADLETQSMKRFDDGNARAAKTFEDDVNRELDAYKDDRYSGWFGWARKAKDWWHGMDDLPRVKEIFETNKDTFVRTINQLVEDISADNKRVVQECKDELTQARADIKEFVDKLKPELKGIADKTAGEVTGKLDALDGFIRKKEEELQQKLADKQQAAIKAIDEKIEKMKEDMAGALSKLGRLLVKAAKKFFVWALGKFGYSLSDIESIIDKGIAVIKEIFTHPIRFVKNLVAAAKQGFVSFGKNFVTHLQDAIFDWLTGSLEGITLPASWDLKGIASVALQIIGLTWTHVRAKLVTLIGEPVVKSLETGFDLVVSLVRDGPMAAWEKLQEMGEEIKQAFVEGVTNFVKISIVQKAIETIVEFFVPGAGIVRAIIGIYDTIVFFIQKARQILEMVGNFLGSIGDIATGNIDGAAKALEKGLAGALLLVVNFLAGFLRLKGITAQIRTAIEKLRGKVWGMLDRVAEWVVSKAKQVGRFIARGTQSIARRIASWWTERRRFTAADEEVHTLSFSRTGSGTELMLSSLEMPLTCHLDNAISGDELSSADKVKARQALIFYKDTIAPVTKRIPGGQPPSPAVQKLIDELPNNLNELADKLGTIGRGGAPAMPAKQEQYGGPTMARILRLSNRTSHDGQDASAGQPKGWKLITERGLTSRSGRWVRMHLVTAGVGGKDLAGNLIPAPTAVNTGEVVRGFETRVECILYGKISSRDVRARPSAFRSLKQRNAVIWVEARSAGYWPAFSELDPTTNRPNQLYDATTFATAVAFASGMHFYNGSDWVRDTAPLVKAEVAVPKPDFSATYQPNINAVGEDVIARIAGIDANFARQFVDERGGTPAPRPFSSAVDFGTRMRRHRQAEGIALTPEFLDAVARTISAVAANKMKWKD